MKSYFLLFASWVVSIMICGGTSPDCREIIGKPDGVSLGLFQEFAPFVYFAFDGPRAGGVDLIISGTEYHEPTDAIVYFYSAHTVMKTVWVEIPSGNSVISISGPPGVWSLMAVQGADIHGFYLDAVQTNGDTWRGFLPGLER